MCKWPQFIFHFVFGSVLLEGVKNEPQYEVQQLCFTFLPSCLQHVTLLRRYQRGWKNLLAVPARHGSCVLHEEAALIHAKFSMEIRDSSLGFPSIF